jgi:metal-dependent HD superfamily phosphatase/phosphodiesterase
MSIQRKGHEEMSLFLTNRLLHEILADVYPIKERTIIISETLHAILSHRSDGKPLTLEAGIVRVADALDMAEGRSRIAFDSGTIDIHSVSAIAIRNVRIEEGVEKPVHLVVEMENSAGIFQVDSLFNEKIKGSGLEQYISLSVENTSSTEKKIVNQYEIK